MGTPSTRTDTATELLPSRRARKRFRSIWKRMLLAAIFLLAALSGLWFLGVCPSLQHQALLEIDRAWGLAESKAGDALSTTSPSGPRNFLISEQVISHAFTFHNAYESQVWQVIVTPAQITIMLSFSGCGQNCTLTAVLTVGHFPRNDTQLPITDAHVQGMLALVLSDGELANALQSNVQILNRFIFPVIKITLLEYTIDIQLQ